MARPLKSAAGRFLLRPLNVVFGAPSHVAILRALAGAAGGLTGREVARAAGVAPRAAMEGLRRLEEAGIVRHTPVGRAYLFELCRDHRLVRGGLLPLLERESELRLEAFGRLRHAFRKGVVAGCVFGSAARGGEGPGSDLDVLLIVEHRAEKDAVQGKAARVFDGLQRDWGVRSSSLVLTRREFVRGYRAGKEFMRTVVREGERFAGQALKDLVRG